MKDGPFRIMLIDDDEQSVHTLQRALALYGYRALTFTDPTQAMDAFRQNPAHLVLTDFKMPGLSGFDVLSQVKSIHPATYVIIFTGFYEYKQYWKSMEVGAYSFISKPINMQRLMMDVRFIEQLWQECDTPFTAATQCDFQQT